MRKGVADLHRRAEVSQAANDRYLQALASVEDTTSLGELAARLCRPSRHNGRRVRALNPHAPADAALLSAISRGEFTLNGFRNRDLRALLFNPRESRVRPNPGSGGEPERLHLIGVLSFDDEFREDVGCGGIQEKFRHALAQGIGHDQL